MGCWVPYPCLCSYLDSLETSGCFRSLQTSFTYDDGADPVRSHSSKSLAQGGSRAGGITHNAGPHMVAPVAMISEDGPLNCFGRACESTRARRTFYLLGHGSCTACRRGRTQHGNFESEAKDPFCFNGEPGFRDRRLG